MSDTQRYWDGCAWTDHLAPLQGAPSYPPQAAPPQEDHGGLVTAGYITALLLPIVGFIVGIVLLVKGKAGHGVGAMAVSIVAVFFWSGVVGGV